MRMRLNEVTAIGYYLETFLFQIVKEYKSKFSEQESRLLFREIENISPNLITDWDFTDVEVVSLFQIASLKNLVDINSIEHFYFFMDSRVIKEFNKFAIEERPKLFLEAKKSPHNNLSALKDVFGNVYLFDNNANMLHYECADKETREPVDVVFYDRNWCWINLYFFIGERMTYNGCLLFKYNQNKLMPIMQFSDAEISIVKNSDTALINFLREAENHLKYRYLTDLQINDYNFIKQAIDNKLLNEMELAVISDDLKDNDALFEYAISQNINYYSVFSERLRENKHAAMNFLNQNQANFFNLPVSLKSDKTFLIDLLRNNGEFIEYLNEDFQQDYDIIRTAVFTYKGALYYQLKYFSNSLSVDTVEDCLFLLEGNTKVFNLLQEKFKYNIQILTSVVAQNPSVLLDIDTSKLDDLQLMTLIEVNPAVYLFCKPRNNPSLALLACEKSPSLFIHIDESFKNDLDFVKELLTRNPSVRNVLPESLLSKAELKPVLDNLNNNDEDDLPF